MEGGGEGGGETALRRSCAETVVVGNGPSGLAASAVLGGWRPFYDQRSPHPSRGLHSRLSQTAATSLVEQDLSWLADLASEGGPGVGSGSHVARLYDSLARPDADLGHEHRPSLRWERTAAPADHLVIGGGPPGGSWHSFPPYVYTLSLANWMTLPGPLPLFCASQ